MKNIKLYIGIIIGLVLSGIGVYALSLNSKDVSYKNSNVSDAIDELYERTTISNDNITFQKASNFTYTFPEQAKKAVYVCGAYNCYATYKGNSLNASNHGTLASGAGLNYTEFDVDGGSIALSATWPAYGLFLATGSDLKTYFATTTTSYTVTKDSNNAVVIFGYPNGSVTVNGVSYPATSNYSHNSNATIYITVPFSVKKDDVISFSTSQPGYGILVVY